jgi:hypothetical protein
LFGSPPLSITTPSGTATLLHSHGNGLAWEFDPRARGELADSTFFAWLRPLLLRSASGETAPDINDSTRIVELIRVDSRPRCSVCLAVTSGVASVVILRHNVELNGSPARLLAARVGYSLRKHGKEEKRFFLVDGLEGSEFSGLRFKVFLGVGKLYRSGGTEELGFVERLALQSLGIASPAAVLAAMSLTNPQPCFTPRVVRCPKPVSYHGGDFARFVHALVGAAPPPSLQPLSKGPPPASGSALSAAVAAEAVQQSLHDVLAGVPAVIGVAPVPGEVQGSGPRAPKDPARGLCARVLCAPSQTQVLDAVGREVRDENAAELVAKFAALKTEEQQKEFAASHMANPIAVHMPPGTPLAVDAVANDGSADLDSVHSWTTKPDFPLLRRMTELYPLPPHLVKAATEFNAASEEALRLAPTSVMVASLLAKANGAPSLQAAREVFLAQKTPVAATLARQCAALSASLDTSAVAIVYALQQLARGLCASSAIAMEGVMVSVRLAKDNFPPKMADPTVCRDMPMDQATAAYCCLSNPAATSGLPIFLQLHVSRGDLHRAMEDVVRAFMFLRPDYRNTKLRAALSTMGDESISVPGGMLVYVAVVALLSRRAQLGAHAPAGSVVLLLKAYNNKVYEASVGVDCTAVTALPTLLPAAAPRIVERLLNGSSAPTAFLLAVFSGPASRTVLGVGFQFTAVSGSGAKLLWYVPAAAVRNADSTRRLLLGAPAAVTSSSKLFFPPDGGVGVVPPADVVGESLNTFGVFHVGGLPPPILFFMASLPTPPTAPAVGAKIRAMQVYTPTLRSASAAVKAATEFPSWLSMGSVDLGRLSEQCDRAITALSTLLAHASVIGAVSRIENSYEMPPFDSADASLDDLRARLSAWLCAFLEAGLADIGNSIVLHGYGVPAPVALGYVRLQATGLLALQTLTCEHIRRAQFESNTPLTCALYDYLRQVNGAIRNLLSGSHAGSMYPTVVASLGRLAAVPFPPRCLVPALRGLEAPAPIEPTGGPGGIDAASPYALFAQLFSTTRNASVKVFTCSGCTLNFPTTDLLHEHLRENPSHKGSHLRMKGLSIDAQAAALRGQLSPSQDEVVTALQRGSNVLVIGHAGYCKSFLLDVLTSLCLLWASAVEPKVDLQAPGRVMLEASERGAQPACGLESSWISAFLSVTSSTNATAAALGAGVKTFHSLVGQSSFLSNRSASSVKVLLLSNVAAVKRLRKLRLLFVDEFARLADADIRGLHLALCEIFESTAPFGGIQVCFLGDPVSYRPL